MVWLRNPTTGRNILKGGRTYNRLKKEGYKVDSFSRVRDRWTKQRKRSPTPRKKIRKAQKTIKRKKTTSRSPERRVTFSNLRSRSPGRKGTKTTKGRPLKETLKDVPKGRKAERARLRRQVARAGEGRGSRTRGWGAAAPHKGKERQALFEKCGAKCFLEPNRKDPGKSGFPVCAALREKQGCKIDCRGVTSAYARARQWESRHPGVPQKAKRLQDRIC